MLQLVIKIVSRYEKSHAWDHSVTTQWWLSRLYFKPKLVLNLTLLVVLYYFANMGPAISK